MAADLTWRRLADTGDETVVRLLDDPLERLPVWTIT
jgi:hypothetical protein